MEYETSLEVMVLLLAAAAAGLGAWWIRIRQEKRRRHLVEWIKENHAARWAAIPTLTRRLHLAGGVEYLRRNGLGGDANFMARYRESKRETRLLLGLLLLSSLLIGMVPLGIRYLGWVW